MLVTGIGQCSWDYIALVGSYPGVDTKEEVLDWQEQGGGPVATALVALSRLGVRCRFLGLVGADEAGDKIRRSLEQEGVDTNLIKRGAFSQTAFIAVEKATGRRTIFWRRPSAEALRPRELAGDFLRGSDFLLLDGLMAEVSLHAAREARSAGVPVMLDAGRLREGMADIARASDYVVASEEFALGLGWRGKPEGFQETARGLTPGTLTITLGEKGSVTFRGDDVISVPAFEVRAVDTTGAGDVFHGGYIYGLVQGWEMRETLRFASALAAMKCRALGGRVGIPGLEAVMEFLKQRE
jgi:sulfofructose kinase